MKHPKLNVIALQLRMHAFLRKFSIFFWKRWGWLEEDVAISPLTLSLSLSLNPRGYISSLLSPQPPSPQTPIRASHTCPHLSRSPHRLPKSLHPTPRHLTPRHPKGVLDKYRDAQEWALNSVGFVLAGLGEERGWVEGVRGRACGNGSVCVDRELKRL